jgi:APA family basic amino acid/polyamine antiporter
MNRVRSETHGHQLQRQIGVGGATMLGLGSMLGTGVFVSLGLAAGLAGSQLVLAVVLAAGLALCNALSSAQLAAAHPVSGGTYEYGYRLLTPSVGFTAGWMFLLAKSASAATAALGLAGYLLTSVGVARGGSGLLIALGLAVLALLTALVLTGLRRSSAVNIAIVSVTLLALVLFVVTGLFHVFTAPNNAPGPGEALDGDRASGLVGLLQASALTFVAYTGYGRIATLGEEVRQPNRTIPAAVLVTMAVTAVLYAGVALVGLASVGPQAFAEAAAAQAAPLAVIARTFGDGPWVILIASLVTVGAITAMLGVLLNLILGLSRVILAMARRQDLPIPLARLNADQTTPTRAVAATSLLIGVLIAIGSVEITWSFSALTVLIYYGITNWAALRLPVQARLYPRFIAWLGLVGCLGLAAFVDWRYWLIGASLLVLGLVWHRLAQRRAKRGG